LIFHWKINTLLFLLLIILLKDNSGVGKFKIPILYNGNLEQDINITFKIKINNQKTIKEESIVKITNSDLLSIKKITINNRDNEKLTLYTQNNTNYDLKINTQDIKANSDKNITITNHNIDENGFIKVLINNPKYPFSKWYFRNYIPSITIKRDSGIADQKAELIITNNRSKSIKLNIKFFNKSFTEEKNETIDATKTKSIFFNLDKTNLQTKREERFNVTIKSGIIEWNWSDKIPVYAGEENEESGLHLLWIIVVLLFLYPLYRIPKTSTTKEIIKNPNNLFKLPPSQLDKNIRCLKRVREFDNVLSKLSISKEKVSFVIDFIENGFNQKNIEYFSKKLDSSIKAMDNNLYRIILPNNFRLNIKSFYFCMKKDDKDLDLDIEEGIEKLQITMIISRTKELQNEIITKSNNFKNKFIKSSLVSNKLITPTIEEIMRLLLAKDYSKELENIFVKYIEPKYISPFSSYEYLDKKKEEIIFNINTKLQSLIILGAEKSGKSYLLKRIKNKLSKNENITICYIEIREDEDIVSFIRKKIKELDDNKQIVFLVDDIDNFILDEKKIIRHFREMNFKDNVFFIITGFWELYKELNFKEKSPLQNFAEVKEISGEMDRETSKIMVTESMKLVNVKFQSEEIIDSIIINSGYKVSLINLICHELLENLNNNKFICYRSLQSVLENEKLLNEIKSLNNFDNNLEKIIVYIMVDIESFTINELKIKLNEYGIVGNNLQHHLKKLLLNDIFFKENEQYRYRIPLLQKILKEISHEALIDEIREFDNFVPKIEKIKSNPMNLYKIPYLELHKIYQQLENTNLIHEIIHILKIKNGVFQKIKDVFYNKNKFDIIVKFLVYKLHCNFIKEKEYFIIKNLKNFPLSIEKFIIYFTLKKDYNEILNKFNGSNDIVLIINIKDTEVQKRLHHSSLNKIDKFIAPKVGEVTKLFLSPNPIDLLLKIFSRHLSVGNISPYQVEKGVKNASIFFGREKFIADITQREPRNYLVVGARRVGKSSLLKAIQRQNIENPNINSFYLTLSDGNLERKILDELRLNDKNIKGKNINNLRELKIYLKEQKKPYIFLIDEADSFVEDDRQNRYKLLKILGEMSEEGYVSFILAGFWQLYKSNFEYQSPLLNFGDLIEIAELEQDACKKLIVKPMSVMQIKFNDHDLVEQIIYEMGQKAQLISLVCQELLTIIQTIDDLKNKSIIDKEDVEMALDSKRIREELGKWIELEEGQNRDEKGEYLRQIIVYAMLEYPEFTTEDVQKFLRNNGININLNKLEYSLELLVLSFFLKKEKDKFNFRIPRQRELLREDNVNFKINENIISFLS
jgi:predicted AAA+ superfamily ATPase